MKLIQYISLFSLLLFSYSAGSQDLHPKEYFRSPVDFPILLSGTFGEIRGNHFHSGIDIKTNGHNGAKIYAIADGYVSRIKISAYGFGKTLYITHPNGYVSVYAHLDRFNKELAAFTIKKHYEQESFELNIFPEKDLLKVSKGEVIGYSGNSGYSFGPHLHFEIREEANQKPLNPLFFGFKVKDFIRPKISALTVYPATRGVEVNGKTEPFSCSVEGWGEKYRLPGKDTLTVTGPVYLGIETHDLLNDANNKNGVYSVEIRKSGETVFLFRADSFSFSETRYVNSLIDYGKYIDNGQKIIRSKIDPNNLLSMYGNFGEGIIAFEEEGLTELAVEVKDINGNISRLAFHVFYDGSETLRQYAISAPPGNGSIFRYDKTNLFENGEIKLEIPYGALYDSFEFTYDTLPAVEGSFSAIYRVHNDHIPLHTYCSLALRLPAGLSDELKQKCLLAKVDKEGIFAAAGGEYNDGYITAGIRELGDYTIVADTMAPEIIPLKYAGYKSVRGLKKISFKIKDELSGIKEYRGELNGDWVLMEYDAKNDMLFYDIDERMKKGINNFRLIVMDMKGNESEYSTIWEY